MKRSGAQHLSMAHRTHATLEGPVWKPRALPYYHCPLAERCYSRCTLTDAQWRGRNTSTDMLAPPLPMQPRVLRLPLPQGSPLAHIKLNERLGSLGISCRAVSEQLPPPCAAPCHYSIPAARFCFSLYWTSWDFLLLISPACQVRLPFPPSSRSTAPQKRDGVNKSSNLTVMCFPNQGLSLMVMCLCCGRHCR